MTIKKIGIYALLGIVVIGLLFLSYSYIRNLLVNAALGEAKAKYEQQISELNAKIKVNTDFYTAIIGDNEKKRLDEKAAHEAEKRKFQSDIGYFKSETAETLKAKHASEAEWAANKVKDEITINLATERIAELDLKYENILKEWKASDERIDAAHNKIVDDLTFKFQTCQDWSNKLESKLRPKPFSKVIQLLEIGAAFGLGLAL